MNDNLHPLFRGIIEGLILPPAEEPEDHTADMAREDYERDQADAALPKCADCGTRQDVGPYLNGHAGTAYYCGDCGENHGLHYCYSCEVWYTDDDFNEDENYEECDDCRRSRRQRSYDR